MVSSYHGAGKTSLITHNEITNIIPDNFLHLCSVQFFQQWLNIGFIRLLLGVALWQKSLWSWGYWWKLVWRYRNSKWRNYVTGCQTRKPTKYPNLLLGCKVKANIYIERWWQFSHLKKHILRFSNSNLSQMRNACQTWHDLANSINGSRGLSNRGEIRLIQYPRKARTSTSRFNHRNFPKIAWEILRR